MKRKRKKRASACGVGRPGLGRNRVAAVFCLVPEREGIQVPLRRHVLNNGVTVLVWERLSAGFEPDEALRERRT